MVPERFRPGRLPGDLAVRLLAGLGFGVWFWTVYLGCDALAQDFAKRFSVHIALDDRMPFLPELGFAYLLINPLLLVPVLALRETADLLALCAALAVEVALAGAVFLAFPVAPPVTPPHDSSWLSAADAVNLTFNSFPSLHVALAVSVGLATGRAFGPVGKAVLWAFVLLVAASTVLTRQHFLMDVLAGAALACAAMSGFHPLLKRWFARRLPAGACERTRPCPGGSPEYGSCSSDRRPQK